MALIWRFSDGMIGDVFFIFKPACGGQVFKLANFQIPVHITIGTLKVSDLPTGRQAQENDAARTERLQIKIKAIVVCSGGSKEQKGRVHKILKFKL